MPGYTRQEVWFWKGEPIKRSSNDMFYMASVKPDFKTSYFKEVSSLWIDLKPDTQAIFEGIKPNFRNEIRKAETLGCKWVLNTSPGSDDIKEFIHNHFRFVEVTKFKEEVSLDRLNAYIKNKLFVLTKVTLNDQMIATHAYLLHQKISAALLYSHYNVDVDSALRGYANKFLHWQDMQYFKEQGFGFYDFGGIDLVDTPEGVAKFKQSFGGEIVHGYNFSAASGIYGLIKGSKK
jgi:lipid II:glycine glycyltransferase (peptidoglycan interpeptide bridge formation enzyme)